MLITLLYFSFAYRWPTGIGLVCVPLWVIGSKLYASNMIGNWSEYDYSCYTLLVKGVWLVVWCWKGNFRTNSWYIFWLQIQRWLNEWVDGNFPRYENHMSKTHKPRKFTNNVCKNAIWPLTYLHEEALPMKYSSVLHEQFTKAYTTMMMSRKKRKEKKNIILVFWFWYPLLWDPFIPPLTILMS